MNFENYVYDHNNDIEELLLEEIIPPPITRQRAYNINNDNQFTEVNLAIPITSTKSYSYYSHSNDSNINSELPPIKKMKTI